MTDKRISQLTRATTPDSEDLIPLVQSGNTRAMTVGGLFAYSGAVNVKSYGAVADGVTDDSAAIQAAIDAEEEIIVPGGTYLIGAQINVKSGRTLYAAGVTLKPSSASVDVLLIQNNVRVLGHPTIDTTFVTYTGKAVTINTATALMNFNTRSVVTFRALGISSQGTGLYVHNNASDRYISGLVVDCNILRFDIGIDIYSQHASGFINGNEFRGNVYGATTALLRLRGPGAANGNRFPIELQPYTVTPFSAVGVQIDRGSNNSFVTNFWDKAVYTTKPVVISGADGAAASNTFHDLLQDLKQSDITNTVGSVQNIAGIDWVGTWTPTITFGTPGDLSVAYTTRVGNYVKKGRRVFLDFNIVTSTFTHTTAAGGLLITGLPYTSSSGNAAFGPVQWQGITKANYTDIVAVSGSAASFLLVEASGSAQSKSAVSAADMPTGGTVILNGTISYLVDGP